LKEPKRICQVDDLLVTKVFQDLFASAKHFVDPVIIITIVIVDIFSLSSHFFFIIFGRLKSEGHLRVIGKL